MIIAAFCFAALALAGDGCCSGIYGAMPFAGPSMCPKVSNSFPTEPNFFMSSCSGHAVDIIGEEGRKFKCRVVQCDNGLSSVFVSRCAMSSKAALSSALGSTGGLDAGFKCMHVVIPINSGSIRLQASNPYLSISIFTATMLHSILNVIINVNMNIFNLSPHGD